MKKFFLFMSILLCSLVVLSGNVKAAEKKSGKYCYEVIDKKKRTAAITHVSNAGSTVKIPKKIKGYTVVQIGRMEGNTGSIFSEEDTVKVKDLKLPATLRKIGVKAFKGCGNLKTIDFPKGLRYIGARAMEKCCQIKKVVLPKELKSIGSYAFYHCEAMEKAVFKTNKANIGRYTFATWPVSDGGTSHLKKIEMPVTYKGKLMDCAFAGYCAETFTWGNFTAENGAFLKNLTQLKKIIIHKKAKKVDIPRECLDACAKQLEIVVPKNVSSVYVGQQRYNIKQITLYGMDTVLEGDYSMGIGDKHNMISAETIKCKKKSMAWEMAKNYLCPDFTNADWELIYDNMYSEKNIEFKKVNLVEL